MEVTGKPWPNKALVMNSEMDGHSSCIGLFAGITCGTPGAAQRRISNSILYMKSGGAYILLDPFFPYQITILLTAREFAKHINGFVKNLAVHSKVFITSYTLP